MTMSNLVFLVMAGGSGERFWPLSTKENPKQYLSIFSDKPLIRKTVERVLPLTSIDNIFVATNAMQVDTLSKCLPELPKSNIIIEPLFKDTAAAIGYGSMIISKYVKDPIICVLASDHLVKEEENFRKTLQIAVECAEKGNIVTLGIKPEYPEIGYGYIQVDKPEIDVPTKCLSFKEKPNLEVAKSYLESGNYLWNSGMFIFKKSCMDEAFKKHAPNHFKVISELSNVIDKNKGIKTTKLAAPYFQKFEKISIDYAVMEKADNVMVVPSSFGWSDVGSFNAFDSLFVKDNEGNVSVNSIYCGIDSSNNIIVSDSKDIEFNLIGIKDKVIAYSNKKLLICEKDSTSKLKELLAKRSSLK